MTNIVKSNISASTEIAVVSSFNKAELTVAVQHFASNAKAVKAASVEMHKALVILAADAYETGSHHLLRQTVNGEFVTLVYKTSIARWLNTYLPHANAVVKADGVFKFNFAKAYKSEPVRNNSEFMANLFNHPFYDVTRGNGENDKVLIEFDDGAAAAILKAAFNKINTTIGMSSDKLAKKGFATVSVDTAKIENAKAALKAIGIDLYS